MNAFSSFSNSARWIISILGILNLLCLSALWMGSTPRRPHPSGPPKHMIRQLIGELNLQGEQRQQFTASFDRHHQNMQSFRKAIDQLREQQLQLMTQSQVDTNRIEQLFQQIGNKHRDREWANFEHYRELNEICTPEQRKKLRTIFVENAPRGGPPHH